MSTKIGKDGELTSKDYYFDSYAHFGIHEEMLKDETRTLSYRKAIYQNGHLFRNKIVLDVGCGTGILSMFAAKAGAKHVYGIDMSNIIDQASVIVRDNNMSDRITLIKGKMEDIELPVEKVDIIISEWMGYFLLYESMLDTVIDARDKYLATGGLIFPDHASLVFAAIEDGDYKEEKINFWDDVYGFNYSSLRSLVLKEPLVDIVNADAVVTRPHTIKEINLLTVSKSDLAFTVPFSLTAHRDDYIHAFIAWFDIGFEACHKPIRFSTGPDVKPTHWKQTVFYTPGTITINKDEIVEGTVSCAPNAKNPRDLDIIIEYRFEGRNGGARERVAYNMK